MQIINYYGLGFSYWIYFFVDHKERSNALAAEELKAFQHSYEIVFDGPKQDRGEEFTEFPLDKLVLKSHMYTYLVIFKKKEASIKIEIPAEYDNDIFRASVGVQLPGAIITIKKP